MSAVAVCRSSASFVSLNNRTFSTAMTAWSANDVMRSTCFSSNGTASRWAVTMAPITLPSRIIGAAIWELYPYSRANFSVRGGASGLPTIGVSCDIRPVRMVLPTWVESSSGIG